MKHSKNRKIIFALLLLVVVTLACSLTTAPQTAARLDAQPGTGTPSPTLTPEAVLTAEAGEKGAAAGVAVLRPYAPTLPAPVECVVTGENVHLRACAGVQCESMAILKAGQVVTVTGGQTAPDGGRWSNVQTRSGVTGWVNSKYIKQVTVTPK